MSTKISAATIRTWCSQLEQRLRQGEKVRAEAWLSEPGIDAESQLELIYAEYVCREELEEDVAAEEYFGRFPHLRIELEEQFLVHRALAGEARDRPTKGQRVGKYELLSELGRGARGAVFHAQPIGGGEPVALKLLLTGQYATPAEQKQFQHEAEVLRRLQHPSIIGIRDAGVADGRPYLAIDLMEGSTLASKLADFSEPTRAAQLIATIAEAIDYAHRQGVIHRDLKPSNILLTTEGTPKVSDFGLARLLDNTSGNTRTGDLVGTISYMAPEQAAGSAHRAGPAADVYALGAILYHLLTGQPPFGCEAAAQSILQLLHDPPVRPRRLQRTIPQALETICLKCLEKDPLRRYSSAQSLADDLQRFLRGEAIAARTLSTWEQGIRWSRRRPALAALLGVIVVAIVAVTLGSLYYNARLASLLSRAKELQQETSNANKRLQVSLDEAEELRAEARLQKEMVERQLEDTRRAFYALQLTQLPSITSREPVRAREILADEKFCPLDLRDFTWRYFHAVASLQEREIRPHRGVVEAVAYLSDERVASGGEDGTLAIWNPHQKSPPTPPLSMQAHSEAITDLQIDAEGRIITVSRDRQLKRFDAVDLSLLASVELPAAIHSLSLIGNSTLAACGCDDGTIQIVDLSTMEIKSKLAGHEGAVFSTEVTADGLTLYSGGADHQLRRWNLAKELETATWTGHTASIKSITCTSDHSGLVTTSDNGEVLLWNLEKGIARPLRGHLMSVQASASCAKTGRLITGGEDSYLKVWDIATGNEVTNVMRAFVRTVAISPDGREVAAGGRDGRILILELPEYPPPASFTPIPHIASMTAAGSDQLIAAGDDGRVYVFQRTSGKLLDTIEVPATNQGPTRALGVEAKSPHAISVSSDQKLLAIGAGEGTVVLWDLQARRERRRLQKHTENVTAVAFHPTLPILVSAGLDHAIIVWDLTTMEPIDQLTGHSAGILAAQFSSDGVLLATAGEDSTIKLWRFPSRTLEATLTGHKLWVLSLAFSPDNRQLASGSRDRSVMLWDIEQRRATQRLSGFTNWVHSVGYTADGKTLAAGSGHYSIDSPGEVRLYDPQAGYLRTTLEKVRSPILFGPDDQSLYVAVEQGIAELRATPAGSLNSMNAP